MDSLFEVHRLNERGMVCANQIAAAFNELLEKLTMICPGNQREFSIVKTKLEEAAFFAKKSMAKLPENQEEKIPA
jgi:hypothetical protein